MKKIGLFVILSVFILLGIGLLMGQVPGKYFGFTANRFWANDGTIRTDNTIETFGASNALKLSFSDGVYATFTQASTGIVTLNATGLALSSGTASRVPYFDAGKILVSSAVTPTELGFISGVTSAVQTQLNGKIGLIALSSTATGLTYTNTTGVFSLTTNYVIPTTTQETNWETAYTHVSNITNPHSVTKTQVGLAAVEDTALSTWPGSPNITTLGALTGPTKILSEQITAGTGTGVTVISAGHVNRQIYKVTVTYEALAAAALTADKIIAQFPAKTKLVAIYADTTIPYTGGTVSAAEIKVGKAAAGAQYLTAHDVFTGAIISGLADADMGTELLAAAVIQGGAVVDWANVIDVYVRLTTVDANTNVLTAGSTTYYLICERY